LDSLDAVEVVMAVEEVSTMMTLPHATSDKVSQEFSIEIPDVEADEIKTVQQGALRPHSHYTLPVLMTSRI
jgi:hypothetical protein